MRLSSLMPPKLNHSDNSARRVTHKPAELARLKHIWQSATANRKRLTVRSFKWGSLACTQGCLSDETRRWGGPWIIVRWLFAGTRPTLNRGTTSSRRSDYSLFKERFLLATAASAGWPWLCVAVATLGGSGSGSNPRHFFLPPFRSVELGLNRCRCLASVLPAWAG